jgi:hypothetical protein
MFGAHENLLGGGMVALLQEDAIDMAALGSEAQSAFRQAARQRFVGQHGGGRFRATFHDIFV